MATFGRGVNILGASSRISLHLRRVTQQRLWHSCVANRAVVCSNFKRHDTALTTPHRNFHRDSGHSENNFKKATSLVAVGAASLGLGLLYYLSQTEKQHARVQCQRATDAPTAGRRNPKLKDFRRADIRSHTSKEAGGIWVTFNEGVYDITEFMEGHPGGEKILLAAGGSLEPFWNMYSVHKNAQVYEILEELRIGNVHPDDMKDIKVVDSDDPYARDPIRHPALRVNSAAPFNAETPPQLLTDNFYTPNELFFVRNHLPVPHLEPKDFRLEVKVPGKWRSVKLSVEDLKKKFKVHTISAAIQCAGNRRSHMAAESKPVKGLSWGMTAISNAEWTGVMLSDVLAWAGVSETDDIEHIIFQGEDKDMEGVPYEASIPAATALDPRREVLLAFKMNGQDIPLDHGYPLRLVVPGSVGARQVKWLGKIIPSKVESDSHWQQKDYKTFTPSIDWSTADFSKAVAIQDYPIQSAITEPTEGAKIDGREVTLKGYAWSGGGRGIIRVEVSADGGKTWHEAEVSELRQKYNRQWAWTLWEATVQLPEDVVKAGGSTKLICKAIDSSHNQQPESAESIWNLRGLIHNAWHKVEVKVNKE